MSNARIIPMTNDQYHGETSAISRSGLDVLLEDPQKYYDTRISKAYAEPMTAALEFGIKFHEAMLHPGKVGNNIVTIPNSVLSRNGSRAGTKWHQFRESYADRTLLKADEPMMLMARSMGRHDAARKLLECDGEFEQTVFWHDDKYDVDRKARFDKVIHSKKLIIDIKTHDKPGTPRDCASSAAFWNYHRQQEWYKDATEEMWGERYNFIFLFVSKEQPHRTTAIRLPEKWIEPARRDIDRGLALYKRCLETKQWWPEDHGEIIDVDPPAYVERSAEWSVEANG